MTLSLDLRLAFAAVLAAAIPHSSAAAQLPPRPATPVVAARVDSLIQGYIRDEGPASISVAILRGTDTLVRRAWGFADVAANRAATEGNTYRIGSTSKQFTAALLLKLVDRGKLSLDDSIGRHLTGLRPEWRSLRIGQILNHTSGLQAEFRQAHRRLENLPADSLIAMATRDSMAFAAGTQFGYSNTGYMILGALVEKLYGRSYSEVLRDEIARPLGLRTLGWCGDPDKAATEVTGHQRSPDGRLGTAVEIHIAHSLGAGGICASASDLATWNRALHGGRVLSPASYAAMTTPTGPAVRASYGFGIRKQPTPWGGTVLGHSGATPGFVAENSWFPEESLSVTILYNTTPPPANGGFAMDLARIALGLPPQPAAAAAAPAPVPAAAAAHFPGFVGAYELAPGRTITISLEDGALWAEQQGRPRRPLVFQAATTFTVGGDGPPLDVVFTVGKDGAATAMTIRQNGNERTLPKVK